MRLGISVSGTLFLIILAVVTGKGVLRLIAALTAFVVLVASVTTLRYLRRR